MARFLVQTIPNKLPELLINLSSQGPHLMGATLPTLLRAVHPGTIAMTDFWWGLRPKVLTVGVGITEKGSWGIAVPKILERARETSPAGRCHHGVAACSDLGPSGVVWHFCVCPLSATFCTLLLSVPDLVNK